MSIKSVFAGILIDRLRSAIGKRIKDLDPPEATALQVLTEAKAKLREGADHVSDHVSDIASAIGEKIGIGDNDDADDDNKTAGKQDQRAAERATTQESATKNTELADPLVADPLVADPLIIDGQVKDKSQAKLSLETGRVIRDDTEIDEDLVRQLTVNDND